jgi:preprotein translocase subunit Sss1
MSTYLQITGLVIDIIGVCFMAKDLLFYDEEILGTWNSIGGEHQKSEKRKVKKNTLIGLGLIAGGFLLQIIAIVMPIWR